MHLVRPRHRIDYLVSALAIAVLVLVCVVPRAIAQSGAMPDRAQRLNELFALLKATKADAEGEEIVAQIWQIWRKSGDAEVDELAHRASLAMGQGLPVLAMPMLDDIVKRLPDWAEGWNIRATALFMMGEYDRSLADIDKVLALEPRHFGAIAGIGLIQMGKGDNRAALSAFRRALQVNPFLRERHGLIPTLEKEVGERPL
jgi:tetratricopeptide (TPR) repeat protein